MQAIPFSEKQNKKQLEVILLSISYDFILNIFYFSTFSELINPKNSEQKLTNSTNMLHIELLLFCLFAVPLLPHLCDKPTLL